MLKISPQQADTFEQRAVIGFVRRAIAHLREKLPDRVKHLSDEQLDTWVRDAMARGEPFNLRTEKQIMCFLDSEALLGARFYEEPRHAWADTILRSRKLHADDRSRLLLATTCSVYRDQPKR